MANKKLKTIQFPGLPDTYTVPQVENGTNNNVAALDGAGNVKDSAIEVSKVAKTDGSYQNLNAGTSDQLNATVGVIDKVPYNFRTAGGSADIGNRLNDKIVGGTIAWNQLSALPRTGTASGLTFAYEGNGRCHITGTVTTDGNIVIVIPYISIVAGHKYLLSIRPTGTYTGTITFGYLSSFTEGNDSDRIYNCTKAADGKVYAIAGAKIGDTYDLHITPQIFDLTQMFGSTIADYIYSLEQATEGAGVAWFKNLFPKTYYEYNAGELMSVCTNAHITRGFNQWDEEWVSGGTVGSYAGNFKNKNKIRVIPNSSLYFYVASYNVRANGVRLAFFDANSNPIYDTVGYSPVISIPNNCYYLDFGVQTVLYGRTYKHDICINLSWSGYRNGEYEPYVEHKYQLSPVELRGIPKLDSANNLYFDGDTYEKDGTVTRRYGIVDMGTLTWQKHDFTDYPLFYADISTKNNTNPECNVICQRYSNVKNNATSVNNAYGILSLDKSITGFYAESSDNSWVYIKDTSYTNVADFKAAMSGVMLYYELATPTTETANPFADPQIVDDFGTEEYVDALATAETSPRDVAIPVGHETFYQANLRDKLQNLPANASADGLYLVKQTGNKQELIAYTPEDELPASPAETGTYILKLVDGTLTWVLES